MDSAAAAQLIQVLEKTISPDQNELKAAQHFLESAAQSNLPELIKETIRFCKSMIKFYLFGPSHRSKIDSMLFCSKISDLSNGMILSYFLKSSITDNMLKAPSIYIEE